LFNHSLESRPVSILIKDLAGPLEPVAAKGFDNPFGCPGFFARWVDIFDAQKPLATGSQCLQVTGCGGDQGSEVKRAGR
jgi:hypothetical protein